MSLLRLENDPVHEVADDGGQEDHEGIDHPLHQGQGHHVAIGHMADFVAHHRLHFVTVHLLQQARAHRHQGVVAVPARGEGVGVRGVEDADLRHLDAGGLGLARHGGHQPLLEGRGGAVDDLDAHGALGHALGHQEGDDRAGEADQRRPDQHRRQIQIDAVSLQEALETQQLENQADDQEDGDVSREKEKDAFHVVVHSRGKGCGRLPGPVPLGGGPPWRVILPEDPVPALSSGTTNSGPGSGKKRLDSSRSAL